MKNLEILYENEFIIIVNKPAGLAVQGGEGVKSSLDRLLEGIFLVHRLDKDTSGVILVAKTREAAARFSGLFGGRGKEEFNHGGHRGNVVKQYITVCFGRPHRQEGVIADDLEIRGRVKKSETRYKVIRSGEAAGTEYSVLELELGTGRMHQIRRHLAMNGNPVLGDDKYGDFKLNKKLHKEAGLKRLLLHASRLVISGEINLDVNAPLPDYFLPWVPDTLT